MKKKAQGLSINAIIVAAIALIVLVVLVAIFTGRLGTWGKGVSEAAKNECEGEVLNGNCVNAADGCIGNTVRSFGATGCETNEICCIAAGAGE